MSKAREIAEERYAKGEITKEEFEQIFSSLTSSEDAENQVLQLDEAESTASANEPKSDSSGCGWMIFIAFLFFIYLFYKMIEGSMKGAGVW